MKIIKRNRCVVTDKKDLEELFTFPQFPIFMGCVSHNIDEDIHQDMEWVISKDSGLIQLSKLIPLDILYGNDQLHGAGQIGSVWKEHHQEFANFLKNIPIKNVLEIGGSHGILATNFSNFKALPWTIIEPNPIPIKDCPAKFIKGTFDEYFKIEKDVDTIVHSHVLEHIYEPSNFMETISKKQEQIKYHCFSVPNLKEMLIAKYNNAIDFEHSVFLTEDYIDFLLAKFGFQIISKYYYRNDHSIFYKTKLTDSYYQPELQKKLYYENKKIFFDYINHYEEVVSSINESIAKTNMPIFLFGAHTFSQYLIAFGLDISNINSILDNDIHKQGKRLYGTSLIVNSPKCLKDYKEPIVILKAGPYNDEIKSDIINNINSNTVFI